MENVPTSPRLTFRRMNAGDLDDMSLLAAKVGLSFWKRTVADSGEPIHVHSAEL